MAGLLHTHAPGNGRFFISHFLRRPVLLAVILAGATASGCSSSDPQIMQVDHYLVAAVPAGGSAVTEALVVSFDLFDPDGEGELAVVEVRLVESDLRWTLPVEELTYHEREGQRWYTTPFLTIDGRARLPRGSVELTVVDLSGREDRQEVQLPRTLPELDATSAARLTSDATIVPGDGSDSMVVVLESGEGNREVRELSGSDEPVPLSRIFEPSVIDRMSAISEPVQLWLLHEWSPRMHVESGPWRVDAAELSPPDDP